MGLDRYMEKMYTFGGITVSETPSALFVLKQVAKNLTTVGEYKLKLELDSNSNLQFKLWQPRVSRIRIFLIIGSDRNELSHFLDIFFCEEIISSLII